MKHCAIYHLKTISVTHLLRNSHPVKLTGRRRSKEINTTYVEHESRAQVGKSADRTTDGHAQIWPLWERKEEKPLQK